MTISPRTLRIYSQRAKLQSGRSWSGSAAGRAELGRPSGTTSKAGLTKIDSKREIRPMPSPTRARFQIPLQALLLVSGAAPPPPINAGPKYAHGVRPCGQHRIFWMPHTIQVAQGTTPNRLWCVPYTIGAAHSPSHAGPPYARAASPWRIHPDELDRIETSTLRVRPPSSRQFSFRIARSFHHRFFVIC